MCLGLVSRIKSTFWYERTHSFRAKEMEFCTTRIDLQFLQILKLAIFTRNLKRNCGRSKSKKWGNFNI